MHHENGRPVARVGPSEVRDAVLGLVIIPAVGAARLAGKALEFSAGVAAGIVNDTPLSSAVMQLHRRWQIEVEHQIASTAEGTQGLLASVLDLIDPVPMLLDRIDIDQIVAERIDLEAIIRRVDIVGLAEDVVRELDLPALVRDSSQTMAAETVDGLRRQGMNADRTLSEFIDRVLRRKPDSSGGRAGPGQAIGQVT
jgi:hypothetical protein